MLRGIKFVSPKHIVEGPVNVGAPGFTVNICVTKHPPVSAYVIVVVPAVMPHNTPVVEPIVPTEVVLLLHVPPGTELLSVVQLPTHAVGPPVIAPGIGQNLTVHVCDVKLGPPTERHGVVIPVTCKR
jgi:hypothetical protein